MTQIGGATATCAMSLLCTCIDVTQRACVVWQDIGVATWKGANLNTNHPPNGSPTTRAKFSQTSNLCSLLKTLYIFSIFNFCLSIKFFNSFIYLIWFGSKRWVCLLYLYTQMVNFDGPQRYTSKGDRRSIKIERGLSFNALKQKITAKLKLQSH